ncbi:MAG: BMP family ABC transporter substrate-binding protein [Oscillospiraceae bacterium]|nr:BMP family ABC transporter substrate-binding protein [Oscillospiraceae bacterium]
MKKYFRILSLCLVLVMLAAAFAGCSEKKGNDKANFKVAFVCSAAGQNDTGYNKSACDAIKEVAGELGVEYKIVEPTNGVAMALETLAGDGYNLIFSLEYDFEALVNGVGGSKAIAEQYPNTYFVIFNDNPNVKDDGSVKHKNVISVLFDVHEASYLAGYAYVLMNENQAALFGEGYNLTPLETARAAGFVGGTNSNGILVYSYGFLQGMEKAAAEFNVNYDYYAKYDAGFTDPAVGSTVAGTFYDNGANIVFADCGTVGDGITSKAKEAGKIAIQVDANLDSTQPGHILTSVLKITGVPVKTITRAYADGSISKMDNLQSYNLSSGATGITDMSVIGGHVKDAALWKQITEKVNSAADDIKSGKIVVVNAQNGETLDPSEVPHINIK